MKNILVTLTGTDADVETLSSASVIASAFEAHLECLFVRADITAILAMSPALGMAPAMTAASQFETLDDSETSREKRAKDTLERFCKDHQVVLADESATLSASWSQQKGDEADIIVTEGRFNDLIVIGGLPDRWRRAVASDVLVRAGRPLLLVPKRPCGAGNDVIAVAWKDTAESARAVTAAMPLLKRCRKALILTACEENGRAPLHCVDSAEKLASRLRRHGIRTEPLLVVPAGRSVAEAITQTAISKGAGTLVMGGYGHSRMREMVFGGVTQYVLEDAGLPVFIFH